MVAGAARVVGRAIDTTSSKAADALSRSATPYMPPSLPPRAITVARNFGDLSQEQIHELTQELTKATVHRIKMESMGFDAHEPREKEFLRITASLGIIITQSLSKLYMYFIFLLFH